MLTGFEVLGAASAVLQVISFSSELAAACKSAYEGATTSQDDLERHSKQMFEAVSRVHTRCEQMATANSRFADPNLQTIAHDCKDAAKKLQAEVQYITKVHAKGNVLQSLRKAIRASRHRKTIQTVEESLFMYQELIHTELMSHLCSQSDAIHLQQERSFHKLDSDIQLLVNQLAKGVIDVKEFVKKEHDMTRAAVTQEAAKAERTINRHIDTQVLDLVTTAETDQRCKTFLQSLKADCMNRRYNDIMDPRDATFEQVFATYQEMIAMYCDECENDDGLDDSVYPENEQGSEGGDSEHDYPQHDQGSDGEDDWEYHDDTDSGNSHPSRRSSDQSYSHVKVIWSSWASFIKWLQSDEMLFYVQGKPGSGKSTLVKFILEHGQTRNLIHQWNPDATILRYFFWKIGSHEQNSIKGLWCSLLYQRLQDRQSLIPDILQHFQHMSLHSSYHDWTIKDLQTVWKYTVQLDDRHLYIFIDDLDEIRNQDGFSRLIQSIQLLSRFPRTKLCVSTRPEAWIMRWLQETGASGFRLEDLTRHDMILFVRKELRPLLCDKPGLCRALHAGLVRKAQGVFLWLHLALQSLIEGIGNDDAEDMLFRRLDGLPEDLETLYMDMWQRLNANNFVYRQTAARYFRYVMQYKLEGSNFNVEGRWCFLQGPFSFQIACADNPEIQEILLRGDSTIETVRRLRICEPTEVSIRTRCAGLLTFRPLDVGQVRDDDATKNAFGRVVFIHRTAHDFLKDTEAGQKILRHDPSSDFSLRCELLKGLICSIMVSSSHWGVDWHLPSIIYTIVRFATRWGGLNFKISSEVLDGIRSLYDQGIIWNSGSENEHRLPFFSFLTDVGLFDDFVISRLASETSSQIATDTLREAWIPGSDGSLSRRLFNALLSSGADPHNCGASFTIPGPFVSKTTAFANLLSSFYISKSRRHGSQHSATSPIYHSLHDKYSSQIIEMATQMARTREHLNTAIVLIGHFSAGQTMAFESLQDLSDITGYEGSNTYSIIYEFNLQFLLLFLLSRAGGDLSSKVLGSLGAEDLLPKVNDPGIRMRYFLHTKAGQPRPHKCISVKWHRVAPEASYLPKHLIEHFLQPPTNMSTVDHLFKVDMKRYSDGIYVSYDTGTDLGIVMHGIKDSEIEEVSFETMMSGLAYECRDISIYEMFGMIPPILYFREQR